MADDAKLSVISKKDARRLLNDPTYYHAIFGDRPNDPDFIAWETEWLTRIARGYTPCDCADRHHGACSSRGEAMHRRWTPPDQEQLF